ncbi:MAG: tRNA uracil 4-sulfurtransferase ThiI [Saccharolobus sp.]
MIIIVKQAGEIAIKSPRTRKKFESTLINNIVNVINPKKIWKSHGVILLEVDENSSYIDALSKIFGIASFSPVTIYKFSSLEDIVNKSIELLKEVVKGKIFAVRVKRIGSHNFTSLDVQREVGKALYPYSNGVNLENPEVVVFIEIRGNLAYFYYNKYKGPKGLPVGVAGKSIVLFSGGIDSPVATWMLMKRGAIPIILNFNLGGKLHKEIVVNELKVLKQWSGGHKLTAFIANGSEILIKLAQTNKEDRVVLLKRIMYKVAERLAKKLNAYSITTGESLSQVSSQTMVNLYVTEYGITYPIFRPLIGLDKEEIVELARKIGTFEYSAKLPEYCTISAKSKTAVKLEEILSQEEKIDLDFDKILDNSERIEV